MHIVTWDRSQGRPWLKITVVTLDHSGSDGAEKTDSPQKPRGWLRAQPHITHVSCHSFWGHMALLSPFPEPTPASSLPAPDAGWEVTPGLAARPPGPGLEITFPTVSW